MLWDPIDGLHLPMICEQLHVSHPKEALQLTYRKTTKAIHGYDVMTSSPLYSRGRLQNLSYAIMEYLRAVGLNIRLSSDHGP